MNRSRPCSSDSTPRGLRTTPERSSAYSAWLIGSSMNSVRPRLWTTSKPKQPLPSGRPNCPLDDNRPARSTHHRDEHYGAAACREHRWVCGQPTTWRDGASQYLPDRDVRTVGPD